MFSGLRVTTQSSSSVKQRPIARKALRKAADRAAGPLLETLESRQLFSIVAPAHIVIVIFEDRFANAIGDTANMPYLNQVAASGLVYTNSHGINPPEEQAQVDYLALFSGSTQGATTDGYEGPYDTANLAQSLNNSGHSFVGYAESMPYDGDTTDQLAADPNNPAYIDLYTRSYNPMAQFTNVGTGKINADVNKTFASFPTTAAGYASLPTVSFVIPNTADNTHGSNEIAPYATDPANYEMFRQNADVWLKSEMDGYLQWAKQNDSLLIFTTSEGDRYRGFSSVDTNDVTTVINGDPRLFVPGVDATNVNQYNLLRTIEDMYGLAPLGASATVSDFDTNAQGMLAAPVSQKATSISLVSSSSTAMLGQGVTFTATIAYTGTGAPTGTVTFRDGTTLIGTGTVAPSGTASLMTSSLALASHSITATYAGDYNFAAGLSSTFIETISQSMTNDNFANRTVLSGITVTANGNNSAATKEAGEPTMAGNSGGKSVWYSWTTPSTGTVTIDTKTSTFDTLLGVYTGTSVSLLTAIASNDDDLSGGTTTSKVTFAVTAGTIYQIAVDGYAGSAGNLALNINLLAGMPAVPVGVAASDGAYTDGVHINWTAATGATAYEVWRSTTNSSSTATKVNATDVTGTSYTDTTAVTGVTYYYWVKAKNSAGASTFSISDAGYRAAPPAPANNNFANRITITGATATVTGTNANATKEPGEPNPGGNAGGKSVWYTWTAPISGTVTIDTRTSNFDTLLGVYTGSSVSTLTTIASNDDESSTLTTSRVSFAVTAGTVYQIAVDGYDGVSGNIVLNLSLV